MAESLAAEFGSPSDHLFAVLGQVTLQLDACVARRRSEISDGPTSSLPGLVICDADVDRILKVLPRGDQHTQASDELGQPNAEEAFGPSSNGLGVAERLDHLAAMIGLSGFEKECLRICLAPEVDRRYEQIFAFVQDDITRKRPSIDLVIDLLEGDPALRITHRKAFTQQARLIRFGLIEIFDDTQHAPAPLISRAIKLNDRIADYLIHGIAVDAQFDVVSPDSGCEKGRWTISDRRLGELTELVGQILNADDRSTPKFVGLAGPEGCGQLDAAASVCHTAGLPLLAIDVREIDPQVLAQTITLLRIDVMLNRSAVVVIDFDRALFSDAVAVRRLRELFETARIGFVVTTSEHTLRQSLGANSVVIDFPLPGTAARARIWRDALRRISANADEATLEHLASTYRLTPKQIHEAADVARAETRLGSDAAVPITLDDFVAGCRAVTQHKLPTLARFVRPRYEWDGIVLPAKQRGQLEELCDRVKYRRVVLENWGFERALSLGKGLTVLFSGQPGTGKSMAAEVIAGHTGLELYRVDLAQVVSKYIGETEKNLRQIFAEASHGNVILLFDEADALFGKRTEIKDAHDRHANVETAFLLQQMEEYDGVAILSTNLRRNIDQAFMRRIHVVIDFPFPDSDQRRRIWDTLFPGDVPLSEGINFKTLADEVQLAGANLRNIALAAAYSAAADGGVVTAEHLAAAALSECQKSGSATPRL